MSKSLPIPQLLQIPGNGGVELCGFLLLLTQRRSESLHLLIERLAIVFDSLGADIAAGGQHMAMFTNVFKLRGLAKTRNVLVGGLPFDMLRTNDFFVATPGMVGIGNFSDILVCQFSMDSINQRAHLASIDEECLTTPVSEALP